MRKLATRAAVALAAAGMVFGLSALPAHAQSVCITIVTENPVTGPMTLVNTCLPRDLPSPTLPSPTLPSPTLPSPTLPIPTM